LNLHSLYSRLNSNVTNRVEHFWQAGTVERVEVARISLVLFRPGASTLARSACSAFACACWRWPRTHWKSNRPASFHWKAFSVRSRHSMSSG